jgi:hypothetical protein
MAFLGALGAALRTARDEGALSPVSGAGAPAPGLLSSMTIGELASTLAAGVGACGVCTSEGRGSR